MSSLEFMTVVQATSQNQTQTMLDRFRQASGIPIQGLFVGWDTLWHDLVNTGIYRKGADISEVGSSWLESLVEMNALKPFSARDIQLMGGSQNFIPSVWETMRLKNKEEIWGIPVRADPRVIWYWKDMVEDSGLDPRTAFSSFEQFPETFSKLSKVCSTPWGIGTSGIDSVTVQTIASWIWKAGGDFISEDGKRVLFTEPETLQVITDYFDLYRFMPHNTNVTGTDLTNMFINREVAAVLGGPWIFARMIEKKVSPEVMAKLGVTTIPGPSFMGGTTLVIWQHCREYEKAVRFVQYLVSPAVQFDYSPLIGLMPVRQETWKMPPYSTDTIYQTMYRALQQGRGLPVVPLWGMIEDRLAKTISLVWSELFTVKNPDTAQVVNKHLNAYARRLNLSLDR